MAKHQSKSSLMSLSKVLAEWGFTWEGLFNNRNGEWLLMIQLFLITAHLLPPWPSLKYFGVFNWPIPLKVIGLVLFILGATLAMISFIKLGANLSPLPEPKRNAELVTNGIYKYIRHPLYLSIILMSIGITIAIGSIFHFVLLIALSLILIIKAKKEEGRLKTIYPEYGSYMTITPAIAKDVYFLDWRK